MADAVALQDDMELVGACDVSADFRLRIAEGMGLPIVAPGEEERAKLEEAGFTVAGLLPEFLGSADVVVDCTPKKTGARYVETYRAQEIKFIFQGGRETRADGAQLCGGGKLRNGLRPRQHARGLLQRRRPCASCMLWTRTDSSRSVLLRRATDP